MNEKKKSLEERIEEALDWFAEDPKFESKYRKPVNCNLPDSFQISNEPLDYYSKLTATKDFEHDSSPEAWKYYHKHYTAGSFRDKKNNNGTECEYCLSHLRYKYCGPKSGQYYVLFAVQNQEIGSQECMPLQDAPFRLRGDCDFNFNQVKYPKLMKKLFKGAVKEKEILLLIKCHDMHHTLLNFSLMQAVGGMQQFKGRGYDRLDRFVYYLNEYYKTLKDNRTNTAIITNARKGATRAALMNYLNQFGCIYNYCAKIYFLPTKDHYTGMMENEDVYNRVKGALADENSDWNKLLKSNTALIDALIASGEEPLSIIEYMLLAVCFWQAKETYFELIDKALEEAKKQQ